MSEIELIKKKKKKKGLQIINLEEYDQIPEIETNARSIDFKRMFFVSDEFQEKKLIEEFESKGYDIKSTSKNWYELNMLDVSSENFVEILEEMDDIKEKFKTEQLTFYHEERNKIQLPSELTKLVSQFIVETNKDRHVDHKKTVSVLRNILGEIYKTHDGKIKFLEEKEIENLAKLSTSKIVEEAELNLNEVMRDLLTKIRTLYLSWVYDKLDLIMMNLKVDDKVIGSLERGVFRIDGTVYKVFKLTPQYGSILFAINNGMEILTFNLGKKRKEKITPFIQMTLLDQIMYHTSLELLEIYIKSIKNLEREIYHDLRNLSHNFEDYDLETLELNKEILEDTIESLYNITINMSNKMTADIRIQKQGIRKYTEFLSRSVFLGGIPEDIKRITPIRTVSEFETLIQSLDQYSERLSILKSNLSKSFGDLIKSKKVQDIKWWQKTWNNMGNWINNRIDNILAEVIDRKTDKFIGR